MRQFYEHVGEEPLEFVLPAPKQKRTTFPDLNSSPAPDFVCAKP